jgi:hypothetical protein
MIDMFGVKCKSSWPGSVLTSGLCEYCDPVHLNVAVTKTEHCDGNTSKEYHGL